MSGAEKSRQAVDDGEAMHLPLAKQLPCSFSFGMVRAISGLWGNRGGLEAGPWGALATGCRIFRSE
jgi:hypothetical protein